MTVLADLLTSAKVGASSGSSSSTRTDNQENDLRLNVIPAEQSGADTDSDDTDEEGEDEEEDSCYSNASTLTSMTSLAAIPKGPLPRNAPARFHLMNTDRGEKRLNGKKDDNAGRTNVYPNGIPKPFNPPRRIPTVARLSPRARPAVLVRRRLQRPTIGGDASSSWWEMPLDALLGYPSLPSLGVWDPLYECEDSCENDSANLARDERSI